MNSPAAAASSGAQALRRLEKLGLEAERYHMRCWIGQRLARGRRPPRDMARHRAAEKSNWACALRGRILSVLGDFDEARSCLDRACGALPEEGVVRAWRGELSLLRGNIPGALLDLDAAISMAPPYPWTYVYRVAARFKRCDLEGAQSDADRFLKLKPGSATGFALKAILAAHRGNREAAEEYLQRAFDQSREGWLYALRGSMRASWNELHGARGDMSRALRSEESPWVRLERASVSNRLGEFRKAFRDIRKSSDALPHDPEPHLRAAAIHLDQAQYHKATERLSRALELSPGDALIYKRRARLHFVQGMLARAQEDIESGCRLAPLNHYLRQDRLQMAIVRGRYGEVFEALRQERFPRGVKEFWLGYLRCRQRRFRQAEKLFGRARSLLAHGSDGLSEKARFYGLVAAVLAEDRRTPAGRDKELSLVGLGYRYPYQISVGALRTLAACEAIYSNLSDPQVTDFLGLFPAVFQVIVFRTTYQQAEASALTVMAGFNRFRRIAMVTRGQPVVCGRLAYRLTQHCLRRGVVCRVPSSVSIFDTIPSLVKDAGGSALGMQVRDAAFLGEINASLPLVLYLPLSRRTDELERILSLHYPQDHSCYLLPGAGENEFVPVAVALKDIRGALRQADPACTLFLPALSRS